MRSLFIIFCCFLNMAIYGQEKQYSYYLYLNNHRNAPQFENNDTGAKYVGDDEKLKSFFNKYKIIKFFQAFPEYVDSEDILNVYYVETTSSNLIAEMFRQFPDMARKFDDLTDMKVEPLYYPNDYGTTSPVTNSGANASRKDLDYLHAPEAWDITKGNSNIILGISDTPIDITSLDLNAGKVTFITGYSGATTADSHGTGVSEIAAGRGNNAHGSVGICMDCNILASSIGFGNTSQVAFSNLYKLADEGARVINMSWTNSGYINDPADGYHQVEQDIINYLVNNMGVVFVAAAGNKPSFSSPEAYISKTDANGVLTGVPDTEFGILYVYPASYDNVISVSSINHKNANLDASSYCCTSPWFPVYLNIEDSVGINVNGTDINNPIGVTHNGYYVDQYNPTGFQWGHTLNEKVDILATGYDIFWYPHFLDNRANIYGQGTSISAPMVTGTIGLMLSVYNCLTPPEIETILKLTAKDIEHMPINQNYVGYVGAGKLEIHDAVNFVKDMTTGGNATIKNHIFYRFGFQLENISNSLTIDNVVFVDNAIADFTAKNFIEVIPGCDFKPDATGYTNLGIDSFIELNCSAPSSRIAIGQDIGKENQSKVLAETETKLYPNPNKGVFEVVLGYDFSGKVNVEIYDFSGKVIYNSFVETEMFNIDMPNLSAGMYIVKLSSDFHSEIIKFIKQ